MKKKPELILLMMLFAAPAFAQDVNSTIREGNDLYKKGQFEQAADKYREAVRLDPSNTTAQYNLANALYKRGSRDEALKQYAETMKVAGDDKIKSGIYYNQGAVLSRQQKLEESIEAYKNALRLNPEDKEARENLQKALLELKKKNQSKQQQKPQDKKDQQKKEQQQQKPQSKMNRKEVEQRLKLLEQKEKEVQQRVQKETSSSGGQAKDW